MRGNRFLKFFDSVIGILLCFVLGGLDKLIRITGGGKKLRENPSIVIIKLAALGDSVLLIPAIEALRKKNPKSKISMIATTINCEIMEKCPYIDEVIIFPLEKISRNPFAIFGFLSVLKRKKFDIAADFDQWSRISALLAYFSGAKKRFGFKTKGQYRHYVYTDAVGHDPKKHEIDCFFDLIGRMGIKERSRNLMLWTTEQDEKEAEELIKNTDKKFIVIHPGCGKHGSLREWSLANYAELSDKLREKHNVGIIITGGLTEINKVNELASYMKSKPLVLAGKLSSRPLISLLKKCKLLVCGNTGVMHLGSALNIPVVALHGPTDHKKWGPIGEKSAVIRKNISCSPCLYLGFEYGCGIAPCMKLITVDDVYAEADRILSGR